MPVENRGLLIRGPRHLALKQLRTFDQVDQL